MPTQTGSHGGSSAKMNEEQMSADAGFVEASGRHESSARMTFDKI
jgi:hypothetical protein